MIDNGSPWNDCSSGEIGQFAFSSNVYDISIILSPENEVPQTVHDAGIRPWTIFPKFPAYKEIFINSFRIRPKIARSWHLHERLEARLNTLCGIGMLIDLGGGVQKFWRVECH